MTTSTSSLPVAAMIYRVYTKASLLYEVVMGAIIADLGVLGSPEPHGIVTVNITVIWSDPKKSPAIALFLFVGYILSFVIRFIVNAPDSLLIKHEHDLAEFEHHGLGRLHHKSSPD